MKEPDLEKIDDAVLALLYLTSFTEGKGEFAFTRAWKGHDWDVLGHLHKKGFVGGSGRQSKVCPCNGGRAEAVGATF
jgi:hypothetical protein